MMSIYKISMDGISSGHLIEYYVLHDISTGLLCIVQLPIATWKLLSI